MLDLLAGRKMGKGISGEITYNQKQITADNASKFASYVSQEDVFVPSLTVWEALQFYTALSLPGDFTTAERNARMWSALVTMGLHKTKTSKVTYCLAPALPSILVRDVFPSIAHQSSSRSQSAAMTQLDISSLPPHTPPVSH